MSDANPVGGAAFASSRGSRSSVELHCSVSVARASFRSPPPKLASSTLESLIDKLGSPGGNPPPSPSQGDATSSRHRIITFSPSSLHRKETTEAPHNHSITPSPLRPDSTQRRKQQPAAVTLLTPPLSPNHRPPVPSTQTDLPQPNHQAAWNKKPAAPAPRFSPPSHVPVSLPPPPPSKPRRPLCSTPTQKRLRSHLYPTPTTTRRPRSHPSANTKTTAASPAAPASSATPASSRTTGTTPTVPTARSRPPPTLRRRIRTMTRRRTPSCRSSSPPPT